MKNDLMVPFVLTKFQPPRLRVNPVSRPRLIELLNEGLRQKRKLTLITAPAGFGKTTLVTEWLQPFDHPFAWISLDEEDNDPARFLSAIIASLQSIDENIGCSIQSILLSKQFASTQAVFPLNGEISNIRSVITTLINDLIKTQQSISLVLDDYHLITNSIIHQAMQYLLEHHLPSFHLIVMTREDPPFSLPRMRVRSELTEIREQNLRFTEHEAAAFLTKTMGLDLSADVIATLDARTEGWIAGLQMVALSLEGQNKAGIDHKIAIFGGSHHYVLDYLAEEVLFHQPQEVRDFMCQTAILDRLCASLCDAVTGRDDSQDILARLERSNLFLIALDDRQEWYRYHHLFRDFLHMQLKPHQQIELHHRAAQWYEAHDLLYKAVDHVLATGDQDEAERVIALASRHAIQEGLLTTTLKWLDSLPIERVRCNSELAIFKGWVLSLMGKREAAETFAAWAEASQAINGNPALMGLPFSLQAYLAVQRRDIVNAQRLAQKALAIMDMTDPFLRIFYYAAVLSLGQAQRDVGDTGAAIETFRQVAPNTLVYGINLGTMGLLEELCLLLHLHGRRGEAAFLCQQTIHRCHEEDHDQMPILGIAYIVLAIMQYEGDDLSHAYENIRMGLALCQQLMMPAETVRGQILLALLLQAMGKDQMASVTMREACQIAEHLELPYYTRLVNSAAADLFIRQGHLDLAAKWVETNHMSPNGILHPGQETEYLVYAHLLLQQNQFQEARLVLNTIEHYASEKGHYSILISTHVFRTLLALALDQKSSALDNLEKALRLAAPRGYYRAFLDAGDPIAGLLPALRSIAPEMVEQLLSRFNSSTCPWIEQISGLADPLSTREIEVLRLVANGLSNREAAKALFVSEETVKKHLSHIFEKLSVKNRIQAVARAKENGLLR